METLSLKEGCCALCESRTDLRESHILPSFVYSWLKRTSATGKLRFSTEPNRRGQDGLKYKLLCNECENRFSEWERLACERLFVPLHEENARYFPYGPWLLKFAVSISWRVLCHSIHIGELRHLTQNDLTAAAEAFAVWRDFLRDKRPHPGEFEQHIVPMGLLKSAPSDFPDGANFYINRAVGLDLVRSDDDLFVYGKMCALVVVGFIRLPRRMHWRGTKIHVHNGTVGEANYTVPAAFMRHFMSKASVATGHYAQLSDRQKQVVDAAFDLNDENVINSKTMEAILLDYSMGGGRAFVKKS